MSTTTEPGAALRNKRPVLVTRPEGRGDDLVAALAERGIAAVHSPFIEFTLEDSTDLRDAVTDLARGEFDLLLLTSATTVRALTALPEWSLMPSPQEWRAAAVGEVTAAAARDAGIEVDVIAAGSAASLLEVLPPGAQGGDGLEPRVLYPVSAAAPAHLETALRVAGYNVQRETAYRPHARTQSDEVSAMLRNGGYSLVVATSPMIVRAIAAHHPHEDTRLVVIGQPTLNAAHNAGLEVAAIAASPSNAELANAVANALIERPTA